MERNEGHDDRNRNDRRDLSSDRRGPFDENRRGGSGGRASFMQGGHDQTGGWQGSREDQGRRSEHYSQSGYGERRDEQGTFGSRDRPGEYLHQGGSSVTGGETNHWGEVDYGRGRTPGQDSQPGYGSSHYGGEHEGWGAMGGRHAGRPFGRDEERGYRSREYAGGQGYDPQYGQGGSYGGGIHRRDAPGQQGQVRYGQQSGYGGQQPSWQGPQGRGEADYGGRPAGYGAAREAYGPSGGPQDYGSGPSYGGSSDWGRRHEYGAQGGYGGQHWGENRYGGQQQQQSGWRPDEAYGQRPREDWREGRYGVGSGFGSGSSTWGSGGGPGSGLSTGGTAGLGSGMGGVGSQTGGSQSRGAQQQSEAARRRGPKNYQRSDERLRELISDRLLEDPHIDSSEVNVEVKSGEVSLTGTVDDRRTKYQIEELVEQIYGVRDIDNRLKVRRGFLASLFGSSDESPARGERESMHYGAATDQREGSQGGAHQYGTSSREAQQPILGPSDTTGTREEQPSGSGMQTSGSGSQTGATPTTSTTSTLGATLGGASTASGERSAGDRTWNDRPTTERNVGEPRTNGGGANAGSGSSAGSGAGTTGGTTSASGVSNEPKTPGERGGKKPS